MSRGLDALTGDEMLAASECAEEAGVGTAVSFHHSLYELASDERALGVGLGVSPPPGRRRVPRAHSKSYERETRNRNRQHIDRLQLGKHCLGTHLHGVANDVNHRGIAT